MKKKVLGFSLIEVLIVIAILAILMVVAVPNVTKYITKGKVHYNGNLEKDLTLVGENYFVENKGELPRGNSYSTFVKLSELEAMGLVSKEFVDSEKGRCRDDSYVRVVRDFDTGEYSYYGCLDCENYKSTDKYCNINDLSHDYNFNCSVDAVPTNKNESGWSNGYNITVKAVSNLKLIYAEYLNKDANQVINNTSYLKTIKVDKNNKSFIKDNMFKVYIHGDAGNIEECSEEVKFDVIPPKCIWSDGDKKYAKLSCSDEGGSGCSSSNPTRVAIVNGVAKAVITDNAGNETSCNNTYDTTPPTCDVSAVPSSKWSNTNVIVTGKCIDEGGCVKKSVSITATKSGSYTPGEVCDKADNCTTCKAINVNIDKTDPTCKITKSPPDVWTNKTVTIKGACYDTGGSGCKKSTVTKDVEKESSAKHSPGTVCDNAGNCVECPETFVNIDKTAPTCKVSKDPSSKWSNKTVTVIGTCTDEGGSGCKSASVTKSIKKEGSDKYSPGSVCDKAGNCTKCDQIAVNIDKTAPTCSVSKDPTSTWSKTNVTVTGKCADKGGSGCASKSVSKTIKTEGTGNYSPGNVCDNAGNCTGCDKKSVKIDKTPPYCDGAIRNGNASNGNIRYKYTFKDKLSGVAAEKHGHCYKKESHIVSEHRCSYSSPTSRLSNASYKRFDDPDNTVTRNYNYNYGSGTIMIYFKLKDVAGNEGYCKLHQPPKTTYTYSYKHTWD